MKATIKDVAQLAGVGIGTASYALNGTGSTKVGAQTRARVLAAARQLNYRANQFGRALKMNQSSLVGVILPTLRHEVFPLVLQGIEDELTLHNYGMMFYTYNNLEELQQKCRCLQDKRVEGIILVPERTEKVEYHAFYRELASQLPVVATSGNYQETLPRVLVDGFEIGRIATEYLLKHGHRRIALVNDLDDWRTNAYREVLVRAGIPFRMDFVFSDFSRSFDGNGLLEWLFQFPAEERPTAIFCLNSHQASDLENAARRAGLQLPRDLSVLGTDDIDAARLAFPALSCVDQPQYQQGEEGVRMLIQIIGGEMPANVLLKPSLVERESIYTLKPDYNV